MLAFIKKAEKEGKKKLRIKRRKRRLSKLKFTLNLVGWAVVLSTVLLNASYFIMMFVIYLQTGIPYAQIFQQEPTLWIFFTEFILIVFYGTVFTFVKIISWFKSELVGI